MSAKQRSEERRTEELYTLAEAESRTKRRVSTWRKDIRMRRIPYVKLGRQVLIPREVIDDLIARGWREPVSTEASA
jgi:excisionase family DNA binding protein